MQIKTMIRHLRKEKKYDYPRMPCSLFMLPDGNMHGVYKRLAHQEIFERLCDASKMESREKWDAVTEFVKKANIVRIDIGEKQELFLDIEPKLYAAQIDALRGLVMSEIYPRVIISSSNEKRVRWLLRLPTIEHSVANDCFI